MPADPSRPRQPSVALVARPQDDLAGLAARANSEHAGAVQAAVDALTHAIAAGEALLAAREIVPRGQWEQWVYENFASPRMTRPYMRLARYKELLPQDVNLTDALRHLRGLPSTSGNAPQKDVASLKDEGLRLRAAGFTQRDVAQILGVAKATIYRWESGYVGDGPGTTRGEIERRRQEQRALKVRRRQRVLNRGPEINIGAPPADLAQASELIQRASALLREVARHEPGVEAKGALVDALTRLAVAEEDLRVAAQITERADAA